MDKKQQISIVLKTRKDVDELKLIKSIKVFLSSFHYVDIIGIHIKDIVPKDLNGSVGK